MRERIIGPYVVHPPGCTDYDPRAVGVAQRVAQVITACLPHVTVEHVGSTAVPGCSGKGIIDLMVIYPDGELEAVKRALRALGFQRQTNGHLHPESRPMRVGTIEHDGSLHRLHIHVLAASSPEVGDLRAFRDRLRANPKLMAEYVARKQAIVASGVTDPRVYTEMKSSFIRAVLGSGPKDRASKTHRGGRLL